MSNTDFFDNKVPFDTDFSRLMREYLNKTSSPHMDGESGSEFNDSTRSVLLKPQGRLVFATIMFINIALRVIFNERLSFFTSAFFTTEAGHTRYCRFNGVVGLVQGQPA